MTLPRIPKPVAISFLIGAIAGITPFLFTQLLPALVNPRAEVSPHYVALLVAGALVGAITAIVYSEKYTETGARGVFFGALGVPAILVATASSLSTELDAERKINRVQERATYDFLMGTPPTDSTPSAPQEVLPIADSAATSSLLGPGRAVYGHGPLAIATVYYYVVIGDFGPDREAGEKQLRKLEDSGLRTQRYLPKKLGLFKVDGRYILVYQRYATADEAARAYKLLRINDPELEVRILRSPSG